MNFNISDFSADSVSMFFHLQQKLVQIYHSPKQVISVSHKRTNSEVSQPWFSFAKKHLKKEDIREEIRDIMGTKLGLQN